MHNLKRYLGITVFIGLLAAAVLYFFVPSSQQQRVYSTQPVTAGAIENVVLTNGVLYPYKLVNVGAQVSGKLQTIKVEVGDKLNQGDVIAQIDNLSQKNVLSAARASLNSIDAQYRAKQAQISQAQLAFDRQTKMRAKSVSSQSAYDAAKTDLLIYKSELDQLMAEKQKAAISVNDAELDLSYTTIDSPISGTVVYVSVEEGQTVNTNQSTPSIVEVAQLNTMTVKAQVSEADIIHVQKGQKVYFSILGSSKHRFNGVVRAIEPGPTLMTGDDSELNIGDNDAIYYNVLFDVDNSDQLLRIGMTAQVSIVLESTDDALLIPSQVLTKKLSGDNRYRVSLLVNGEVESRDIEIGINNRVQAQVLSGLSLGEKVIVGQANPNHQSGTKKAFGLDNRPSRGRER
ncbi:efflux RND transporter periplasmic adaptor subunit [Vibrio gallicus]|uniref:efflux RND transporter periplasmic adaptor subunit n=1 Tax=Vibrio gallicus TaxID=190897 RepID=UPI0021C263D2|nr:efflux RND transporter periplasmic adaptor subunit [Vibrio gallicus]